MRLRRLIALFAALVCTACRTGRSYPGADGPRYVGGTAVLPASARSGDTLRIVSFNIAFAVHVDSAITVLTAEPELRDADVVLLQEMDEVGTRRVAEALGMWYVYYPALFHKKTRRDFGNAVLSRWPIIEDRKVILPHPSRYAHTHRIATAATLRIGEKEVRVYSTHLGTLLDITSSRRRNQLRAILADAERYPRVIVGGDLNGGGIGEVARQLDYAWPTENGPKTTSLGRWDHIFLKGLTTPDSGGTGTITNVRSSSDHRPVWVLGIFGGRE